MCLLVPTAVKNDRLELVCKAIAVGSGVKQRSIEYGQLGAVGIAQISEAVSMNCQLCTLEIAGNSIGYEYCFLLERRDTILLIIITGLRGWT